jgi:hypothetical protein
VAGVQSVLLPLYEQISKLTLVAVSIVGWLLHVTDPLLGNPSEPQKSLWTVTRAPPVVTGPVAALTARALDAAFFCFAACLVTCLVDCFWPGPLAGLAWVLPMAAANMPPISNTISASRFTLCSSLSL